MKFTVTYPSSDEREWVEYFEAKSIEEVHSKAKELQPKDTYVDQYRLRVEPPQIETVYLSDEEQYVYALVTVKCKELDRSHDFTAEVFGLEACIKDALRQARNVWATT
jgi:hypothetical protein